MAIPSLELKTLIEDALRSHIANARDEVIARAIKEFEALLRVKVGMVTLSLLDVYSMERIGNELLIRVQIKGERNNGD